MNNTIPNPSEYISHIPPITDRVVTLKELTFFSMRRNKEDFPEMAPIVGDKPLIVRKAMAEAAKLRAVPKHLWNEQLFAGSFTFTKPAIALNRSLPVYATEKEISDGAAIGFGPSSIFSHIVPDYPRLLKKGVSGILIDIKQFSSQTDDTDKLAFYEAASISLQGLLDFAAQYAEICSKAAENIQILRRREELLLMAEDLETCPLKPAATLHQAMQAVWLTHVCFQLAGIHLSVGRADQYLYPYMKNDLETGRISLQQAQEMCDLFFLKFNERTLDNAIGSLLMDIDALEKQYKKRWENRSVFDFKYKNQERFNVRDAIDATNHWLQNLMLGGVKPDGHNGCNLMTVMMLESFDRLRMTNPSINIRVGKTTPDWCMTKLANVLKYGGGSPCIFNEDNFIDAISTQCAIAPEDARDFANDGCWEVIIPGKTDFFFFRFNIIKCLERVWNRGKSWIDGKQEVPDPGDASEFTWDELLKAVDDQLEYMCKGIAKITTNHFLSRSIIAPLPLLSSILDGPVENGRDMTSGGAKYILCGMIAEGLSHLIDSLVAVKEVVFDCKEATLAEVIDALGQNFKDKQDLRTRLKRCRHYGNGDPVADSIGREFVSRFAAIVKRLNEKSGRIQFMPGLGTFGWFIAVGEETGPSADGRLAAEPLSSNASPSSGVMKRGITGGILSYAALQPKSMMSGSPVDLALPRQNVTGEEGTNRVVGLIRSFIDLAGGIMTLTIGDADMFRRAQIEPEKYRDLRVRMGGWSAYFTMLSKDQQEHHIKKAEMGE